MLADPPLESPPTRRPTLKKQPTPSMLYKKVRLPGDVITAPENSVQSTDNQVKDDIGEGLTGNMKRKAYVLSAWDKMPAAPTSINYEQIYWTSATARTERPASAYDNNTASTGSNGTTRAIFIVRGILVNGANVGTLIARIKREAVGTGPNVRAGSFGRLTKL